MRRSKLFSNHPFLQRLPLNACNRARASLCFHNLNSFHDILSACRTSSAGARLAFANLFKNACFFFQMSDQAGGISCSALIIQPQSVPISPLIYVNRSTSGAPNAFSSERSTHAVSIHPSSIWQAGDPGRFERLCWGEDKCSLRTLIGRGVLYASTTHRLSQA